MDKLKINSPETKQDVSNKKSGQKLNKILPPITAT